MKKIIAAILVLFSATVFSGQLETERMVNKNNEYIEFMNYCISNFGEAQKEEFFEVYQLHFNAQVAFLQSDYSRAFRNIYQSQSINDKLFDVVLTDYYLENSKVLLDRLAPSIIKSQNRSARLYLTLAYRDRTVSRSQQEVARATRPTLHSYRIHQYREAVLQARRAVRYGFLALFESQNVEVKKRIYDHLFEMEREKGNPFYNRFLEQTDETFLEEYHRSFDDYENEYGQEIERKRAGYLAATGDEVNEFLSEEYGSQFLFEQRTERRMRFRHEQRVADYLRNALFDNANDVIHQYVDDFRFKLIVATLEILEADENPEYAGLDFESLMIQHYDSNGRMYDPSNSAMDSFADRVVVVDDVSRTNNRNGDIENTEEENGVRDNE